VRPLKPFRNDETTVRKRQERAFAETNNFKWLFYTVLFGASFFTIPSFTHFPETDSLSSIHAEDIPRVTSYYPLYLSPIVLPNSFLWTISLSDFSDKFYKNERGVI